MADDKKSSANQDQSGGAGGQRWYRRIFRLPPLPKLPSVSIPRISISRPRLPALNWSNVLEMLIHLSIISTVSGLGYLIWTGVVRPSGAVSADDIWDFKAQLKYLLRHQILGVSWLVYCLFNLHRLNRRRAALAASAPAEGEAEERKRISERVSRASDLLKNGMIQLVLSSHAQLILITYLDPKCILMAVPVINLLFLLGQLIINAQIARLQIYATLAIHGPVVAAVTYSLLKYLQFVGIIWI